MTFIRRLMFSNLPTKLLALFLGVLTYLYVLSEQNPIIEKVFVLNAELRDLEGGVIPLRSTLPLVTVKLQGPRQILSALSSSQIEVFVEASGRKEGSHALPVHIKTLPEIEVLSYSPQKIAVKLDSLLQQKFAIEANKIGKLPENFAIEKEEIHPGECTIKGAKSRLAKVRHVLATVDITNTTSALKKQVQLRPIDEEGKDVSDILVSPSSAEIYLKVSLLFPKEVSVVLNLVQPLSPYKLKKISFSPNRIVIQGAKESVRKVSVIKTAGIDLSVSQTNQSFIIPLIFPKGIQSEVQEVKVFAEIIKEEPEPSTPP